MFKSSFYDCRYLEDGDGTQQAWAAAKRGFRPVEKSQSTSLGILNPFSPNESWKLLTARNHRVMCYCRT